MDVFWEVIQVPPSSSHSLPPSHRAVMSSMVVTRHMWSVRGGVVTLQVARGDPGWGTG